VNFNVRDKEGKTAIDKGKEGKRFWENEETYQRRKENWINILKILESFERNPNETRVKLRIQLGLAGKINFVISFLFFFFFYQNISN